MWRLTMHRLMFDTNAIIDAIDPMRPLSREVCEVLERCNGLGDYGMVCAPSLNDMYYVVRKLCDEKTARESVSLIMGLLPIAPIGGEECEMSLRGNEPDFEDGLIRAAAELNDADFIITRDRKAFAKSTVRAVTAAEYLDIIS